jgi:nitrate/nitrite transporter NarK
VGVHFAANTIGMQMAAGALGAAVIPSLVGILARRTSLEVVPVCLMVLFAGLLGLCAVAERSAEDQGS